MTLKTNRWKTSSAVNQHEQTSQKPPRGSSEGQSLQFYWVIDPIKNDYRSVIFFIDITLICHMVAILICNKYDVSCKNVLKDGEILADIVNTQKEDIEEQRKRELEVAISKRKVC